MDSVPDRGGGLELDGFSGPFHSVIPWKKTLACVPKHLCKCLHLPDLQTWALYVPLLIKTGLVWKCFKENQEPAQLILGNGFSGKAENPQHVCGNWLLWGKAG